MEKRIKLADRVLPSYSISEERFNYISHIVGGAMGIAVLVLCIIRAAINGNAVGVVSSCIYGTTLITLYTFSSIYHGLRASTAKKVFQVLDHCTIYFLIAGTYTPIALCAISKVDYPLGWVVFGVEWGCAVIATSLTAIDLKKYSKFSLFCYIIMGWCVVAFIKQTIMAIGKNGFLFLLLGGVFYTVGAILYVIGKKKKYMHCIFHVLVILGSLMHFFSIFFYVL